MAIKKFEDIIKELKKQTADTEEATDAVAKLFEEAANIGIDINEFIEFFKDLIHYTFDNFNETTPWDMVASNNLPKILEKKFVKKFGERAGKRLAKEFANKVAVKLLIAEFVGSALAAPFDYGSDHVNDENQMPEFAQEIYDYAANYNEKVKGVEKQFELMDDFEENAMLRWKNIQDWVDENGKLINPANRDKFKEAIDLMNGKVLDANITVVGDQIQNYANFNKAMDKRIKEKVIEYKKWFLENSYEGSYNEARNNIGEVEAQLAELQKAKSEAFKVYETVRDMRIETEKHQTPDGYEDYYFDVFLKAEQAALKAFEELSLEHDAVSTLYYSYKDVIKMHDNLSAEESKLDYEIKYPDAGKSFAQLEGEAYAKRESEKNNNISPAEYKSKSNLEHESKYLNDEKNSLIDDVANIILNPTDFLKKWGSKAAKFWDGITNVPEATYDETNKEYPTNIITPDTVPYNNEQIAANAVQNNVITSEMAEVLNSFTYGSIIPAEIFTEAMREIGMQSLVAFTEGLLINKDYLAEAAQELTNSIYYACYDVISFGTAGIISAAIDAMDIYNIGYENGSKFAEGFNDSISNMDMNDIFDRFMAARAEVDYALTAGQQFKSFDYYGAASKSDSRNNEKIVLENKSEVTVKLDRDVLGKTMLEWTKEYERRTGK